MIEDGDRWYECYALTNGNQIKPLDAVDKSAMERIREEAVFQYSYSGIEE